MSDTGSKKVKHNRKFSGKKANRKKPGNKGGDLWDDIIKYDKPIPSAQTERIHSGIEKRMAAFCSYKQPLLAILHEAYSGGPQADRFDNRKSWVRLERTAFQYFLQEGAKHEAISNAKREARQRAIGAALKKARNLIEKAILDEVGDDLFSAWSAKANVHLTSVGRNDDGSLFIVRPAEEMFKKTVACLAELETAADRAADEAHQGRGRRPGVRVLPIGYVELLAAQYRKSTGVRPAPGRGPFLRYVCAFLTALGRATISEDYVVELISDANSWAIAHPIEGEPSPFSE
jgi:hypothetical protein